MLQAFMIVLREGFEAFLIVAIILSYLQKTSRKWLVPAVFWGIGVSAAASLGLGYLLLQGVNQSLWEGILGLAAMVMVTTLVIQMWRTAPRFKRNMETRLGEISSRTSRIAAFAGVFLFTVLMITREGMETALMLIQIRDTRFTTGLLMGVLAAAAVSYAWVRFSYLINMKRFFQVTGTFLLLFVTQIGIYSFHEFTEAGILPNSELLHTATERFSPDGLYGKWFSLGMVFICLGWLVIAAVLARFRGRVQGRGSAQKLPAGP